MDSYDFYRILIDLFVSDFVYWLKNVYFPQKKRKHNGSELSNEVGKISDLMSGFSLKEFKKSVNL